MSPALGSVPTLRYFDVREYREAGRGGAIRFFLLAAGVPFVDQVETFDDWYAGKQAEAIASGDSVLGHLPVVYLGEERLTEVVATMRYLSRLLGLYGTDAKQDYQVDMLADMSVEWRNTLLAAMPHKGDANHAKYLSVQRAGYYQAFDTVLSRFGGSPGYSVGGTLSLADALLFTLMWDDQGIMGPFGGRPRYARLAALYDRFVALPDVAAWCLTQPYWQEPPPPPPQQQQE